MSTDAPLLEVRGITKQYPGVRALGGVDFDVHAGEVHCLLGPNGAGKSTLIKCVSGVVAPTEGEILVNGEPLPTGEPSESLARGVATIYQELDLVPDLTVAESVFLGHEPRVGGLLNREKMGKDDPGAARAARPRGHPAGHPRPRPATRRAAGRLDRARAVPRCAPADPRRALGDSRRPRDRHSVQGGEASRRGGRGDGLHLPPPGRDRPDRQPRHRAGRRQDGGHRFARRHPAGGAGAPHGGPACRAAVPITGDRSGQRRARGAGPQPAARREAAPASRCARARSSASAAWSAPAGRSSSG